MGVNQLFINLEHLLKSQLLQAEIVEFLENLNDREREIFLRRLIPCSSESSSTLQELADEFKLTREAIRLAESKLKTRIQVLNSEKFPMISFVSEKFRKLIGTAVPLSLLPESFRQILETPSTQIAAYFAGGYSVSLIDYRSLSGKQILSENSFTTPLRRFLNELLLNNSFENCGVTPILEFELLLIEF
jgi:hypothetical protein